jgi:hypothetical protein
LNLFVFLVSSAKEIMSLSITFLFALLAGVARLFVEAEPMLGVEVTFVDASSPD